MSHSSDDGTTSDYDSVQQDQLNEEVSTAVSNCDNEAEKRQNEDYTPYQETYENSDEGKPDSKDAEIYRQGSEGDSCRLSSSEQTELRSKEDTPQTSSIGKLRILQELEKMKAADEERKIKEKRKRLDEKKKFLKQFEEKRKSQGITILPNVHQSRSVIEGHLRREIRSASNKEREQLKEETQKFNMEIEAKHGLSKKKETDFVALAADFYEGRKGPIERLPENIRRSLTTEEINDLRLVFDMFDLKGKGFITVTDLRRAAGMLGFTAKKKVFVDMIAELAKDSKGRVTFVNFLDFIVRSQGDGPDPYDEILQGFRLLDTTNKGFLTFEDIRETSDRLGVGLSNRAIREMIQEADKTGNGEIRKEDFIQLMLQTNTFKTNFAR